MTAKIVHYDVLFSYDGPVYSANKLVDGITAAIRKAAMENRRIEFTLKSPQIPRKKRKEVAERAARIQNAGSGHKAAWANDEVRTARLTRHRVSVTVDGESREFRSCNDAFIYYGIKLNVQRFRLLLKSSGEEVLSYEGREYVFRIVGFPLCADQ